MLAEFDRPYCVVTINYIILAFSSYFKLNFHRFVFE